MTRTVRPVTPGQLEDSAPVRPLTIRHIPALDGLRGVAVIAVLLFHGGHFTGGYLGVDLFFVLSGFLITSLLLAEGSGEGKVALGRFWERRARRLLPALGVMLVGVALYAWLVADPQQLHRLRMDGLATLFYVANWRAVFAHVDYWALFSSPSPMEHTWSLAIEEQFYVLWPLAFVGLLAWARRHDGAPLGRALANRVLLTAVVLGLVSAALSLTLYGAHGSNRVYFGTDTRAFAILTGVALAALIARFGQVRSGRPRQLLEFVGLVSVGFLAVAWSALNGASPTLYRGGLLACSLAGTLVLAAAAHPESGIIAKVASFTPLRWAGLISYGLYLYHWPIFVWLDETRVHLGGWPLFGVRIAVTLAVSLVSYRLVEQPIRHSRSLRPTVVKLLVPSVGFAAVGALIVVATLGYQAPPTTGYSSAALDKAIRKAESNKGPRIMVVGNSVAFFLAHEGFPEVRTSPQVTFFDVSKAGCTYPDTTAIRGSNGQVSSDLTESCRTHWATSAARFKPDSVVFIRNGVSPEGYEHNGQFLEPCSAGYQAWLRDSLVADADVFAAEGATTVLVTAPYSERKFGQSLDYRAHYIESVGCGNQAYRDAAERRPDTIRVIDLANHLCKVDGECASEEDGIELRPDGTHFRKEGAVVIANWVVAQLGLEPLTGPGA